MDFGLGMDLCTCKNTTGDAETQKVNFSSPEIIGMEPAKRLALLEEFSRNMTLDRCIQLTRYLSSGFEMIALFRIFLKEGEYENAFMLCSRAVELFTNKLQGFPAYEQNLTLRPEVTGSLNVLAQKLKQTLLSTYEGEHDAYVKGDSAKSILQNRQYSNVPTKDIEGFEKIYEQYCKDLFVKTRALARAKPESNNPGFQLESLYLKHDKEKRHPIIIPDKLCKKFLLYAANDTERNIRTLAFLCGQLQKDGSIYVRHLVFPSQEQTPQTVDLVAERRDIVSMFLMTSQSYIIGCIYTFPAESTYVASDDQHRLCNIQKVCPSAIAIACAPKYNKISFNTMTDYGMKVVGACKNKEAKHHHDADKDKPLYTEAKHYTLVQCETVKVTDIRQPYFTGLSEDELVAINN